MSLRSKSLKLGGLATLLVAVVTASSVASAQLTSGITVTPTTVQTVAQFSPAGAKAYTGDAGTITVSMAANTTFKPGFPLSFEECNLDPTAQGSCDGLTLQTTSVGSTQPVVPNADGSVTFTMLLWIVPTGNPATTPDVNDSNNTNPSGFDPNSTVTCDANDPCSIWVGDDASNWSANSFVFNGITPLPNTQPLPTTTTTTAPTTTTTAPTTTTTAPTTTTSSTTSTTSPTTSTTVPSSTTTTSPGQGQVPESPYVPLLPMAGAGVAGAGFILYLIRRRKTA